MTDITIRKKELSDSEEAYNEYMERNGPFDEFYKTQDTLSQKMTLLARKLEEQERAMNKYAQTAKEISDEEERFTLQTGSSGYSGSSSFNSSYYDTSSLIRARGIYMGLNGHQGPNGYADLPDVKIPTISRVSAKDLSEMSHDELDRIISASAASDIPIQIEDELRPTENKTLKDLTVESKKKRGLMSWGN
jgi:hypothetical protein